MKVKKSKMIHKYNNLNLTMKNKNTMTNKNNKVDTNIYALVPQKDKSLKRVLLSDFRKMIKTEDDKNYKMFYQLEYLR